VFLVSFLAARRLWKRGASPAATAGYSLGNYAALVAAGAISYDDALEVLIAVWRETEKLGIRGRMGAVVGARRDAVDEVCAGLRDRGRLVWIGNVNATTQFVLTGQADAVGRSARGPGTEGALGAAPRHELAHPQRADASGLPRRRALRASSALRSGRRGSRTTARMGTASRLPTVFARS
jgi:[acyl-carrier-protein] S-malonyltransferase